MNTFFLDLRQSLRGLWKAPGFMVPAVLSLALGIGANTAAFSALRAALTPQLAWENPQELVFVGRQDARFPNLPPTLDVNYATFQAWQRHQTALSTVAGFARTTVTLGGPVEPRSTAGMRVTPEFWSMLGVKPHLGRLPQGAEDGVFVASHRLWVSALGQDPSMVGKSFQVGGRALTLVGVLPPGAVWLGGEIFVPLEPTNAEKASSGSFLNVVGRMRPGLREPDIQAAFRTLNAQLQAADPAMKPISAVPRLLLDRFYVCDRLWAWLQGDRDDPRDRYECGLLAGIAAGLGSVARVAIEEGGSHRDIGTAASCGLVDRRGSDPSQPSPAGSTPRRAGRGASSRKGS